MSRAKGGVSNEKNVEETKKQATEETSEAEINLSTVQVGLTRQHFLPVSGT